MNEKDEIAKEARKYEMLDGLTKHPGWTVLKDHFDKILKVLTDAILIEEEHKKIITLQARHRAFSSVLQTIQSAKAIRDKLSQDIINIIEDERFKQEFDL